MKGLDSLPLARARVWSLPEIPGVPSQKEAVIMVMQPDSKSQGSAGQDGGATAAGVADQVRDKAGQVADKVQEKAGPVVEQVQQQAQTQLTTQKDRAAEGLGSVAQALRQTGEHLRNDQQAAVASYAEQATQKVDQLASYLRERDLGDMVGEVERFARREPALFLGGAFVAGVLAARFLKSSGRQVDNTGQGAQAGYRGYSGYSGGSGYAGSGGYLPSGTRDAGYSGTSSGAAAGGYGPGSSRASSVGGASGSGMPSIGSAGRGLGSSAPAASTGGSRLSGAYTAGSAATGLGSAPSGGTPYDATSFARPLESGSADADADRYSTRQLPITGADGEER